MERRKFLIGAGSLAAGAAAATGTGAFTSVSANRTMSVQTASDSNALLALVPGESGLVTEQEDTLQINIDGTQSSGTGVNMNAVTTIGDPENPEDDHAFKIVNQGTQSLVMKMNYYFTNTEWLDELVGQSFVKFEIHDTSGNTGSSSEKYPKQNGYNRVYSLGGPTGDYSPTGSYRFEVGEEYYVTMTIDTTGEKASVNDNLSGVAEISATADNSISSDSWYPENPPL